MEFHFVITLSQPIDSGSQSGTLDGVIKARNGETRRDLFAEVLKHAVNELHMDHANVMFFDLAPNTLPAVQGKR